MIPSAPLAESIRPTTLDNYVGQQHLAAKGAVLRELIEKGMIPSMILWGSPGIGKTTLAHIISQTTDRPFFSLSAINVVKEVLEIIQKANSNLLQLILFSQLPSLNQIY